MRFASCATYVKNKVIKEALPATEEVTGEHAATLEASAEERGGSNAFGGGRVMMPRTDEGGRPGEELEATRYWNFSQPVE